MIAVIYSGSKEAHWKIANNGEIISSVITPGFNPFFNSVDEILNHINAQDELITYAEKIKKIYFFGAGASSNERKNSVHTALKKFFKFSRVYISHDIDAVGKAFGQHHQAIIALLGSGANAGFYNGKKVLPNNYGLGYIFADEGSGSHLGKLILKAYLTETMPIELREAFYVRYKLELKQILDQVYKLPNKAAFLNSFTDFIHKHQQHPFIIQMLEESFYTFFKNMIVPLVNKNGIAPIYIVGTTAALFEKQVKAAAEKHHLIIESIVKEPIYKILEYYSTKN